MLFVRTLFALVIILFGTTEAQNVSEQKLSGNLYYDSQLTLDGYTETSKLLLTEQVKGRKSPMLAGLMSLVVPGLGEFYSESYWKAAAFVAIEAAAIIVGLSYDKKGDDKTAEFESYADANWSVVDYARWLNNEHGKNIDINPDENLPPWERVNWSELNAAEIGSHKLPPHGDQQYYELIGKYHQYTSGWNDYQAGSNIELLTPNFVFYAGMRGKANDYYNVASKAVIVIYVNHFLSMLDAVWSAVLYNNNLEVNMRVSSIQLHKEAELIPTLNLRYNF